MSVLILALNPSIDAEWRVADVLWEEKNNVSSERRWAGGKGINVARWIKFLGVRPLLLLPQGGATGEELSRYLHMEKIPRQVVPLQEPTRVNVIVSTKAGRQMRFNPAGPKVSSAEWAAILEVAKKGIHELERSKKSRKGLSPLLVLSGSLPRGVPVGAYAQMIRLANRYGIKTLLDCDGAPFAVAVRARPFLVKPNEHELSQWWGKGLRTEAQLGRAAEALAAETRGWVLVSRGPKPSLLVNRMEGVRMRAVPPRVKPRNTVGAGDAMLAGVAQQIHRGGPPENWLRFGLKIGSAAVRCRAGCVRPY